MRIYIWNWKRDDAVCTAPRIINRSFCGACTGLPTDLPLPPPGETGSRLQMNG